MVRCEEFRRGGDAAARKEAAGRAAHGRDRDLHAQPHAHHSHHQSGDSLLCRPRWPLPCWFFNPPGQWNRAVIVVRGRHVEHWLNDFKVVDYERGSPAFRELVSLSKFKALPTFGDNDVGPILLQDHGDRVDFRSIKLREL